MTDEQIQEFYFLNLAAAFVLGRSITQGVPAIPESLLKPFPHDLENSEKTKLVRIGLQSNLRLHKFKRTMGLARIKVILGVLRNLQPAELLDIGSGRGVFLWPLLTEFDRLKVYCVDRREDRIADLDCVRRGGVEQLSPSLGDLHELEFSNGEFDVTTVLEVLEHVENPRQAIAELCRVTRRFVLMSVPSKPDDNPEHIHLFDEQKIRELFLQQDVKSIQFQYVPGHLIGIAKAHRLVPNPARKNMAPRIPGTSP